MTVYGEWEIDLDNNYGIHKEEDIRIDFSFDELGVIGARIVPGYRISLDEVTAKKFAEGGCKGFVESMFKHNETTYADTTS